MTCNVFDTFAKRRSVYEINNNIGKDNKNIEKIILNSLDLYPSSFNSQETRVILLMGEHHSFFWDIVKPLNSILDAFALCIRISVWYNRINKQNID